MAFKLFSDVRETSTTGGTGDQVLTGAAFDASYFRFNDRYSNADTFFYCMKQGVTREIGFGTRVTAGDKVSRTQVYKSTNANALVNFTNGQTIDIFVTNIAPDDLDAAGLALLGLASGSPSTAADQSFTAAQRAQALENVAQATVTFTTDDTVTTAHRGALITLNAATAKTLSFTAGATLGNGFRCRIKNIGTHKWTLDPNSSELINAAATLVLYPGEGCEVVWDGSAFQAIGLSGLVLLETKTASASATLDFANFLDGYFDEYEFRITSLIPATDVSDLWFRVSIDGGSTYRATASDYRWASRLEVDGAAGVNAGSTADVKVVLATILSNNTARPFSGNVNLSDIASSARFKNIAWSVQNYDSAPQMCIRRGSGILVASTSAVGAARFLMSSGNIAAGTIRLYGVRK